MKCQLCKERVIKEYKNPDGLVFCCLEHLVDYFIMSLTNEEYVGTIEYKKGKES